MCLSCLWSLDLLPTKYDVLVDDLDMFNVDQWCVDVVIM